MNVGLEFHYRVDGRVASPVPGTHAGRFDGDGTLMRGLDPLGQGSDPRRIDLRASFRDPFERLLVRRFRQPGNLTIAVLVDASESMRLPYGEERGEVQRGDSSRERLTPLAVAARFVACAGYSAHRSGDRFACFGADEAPLAALTIPSTQARGAGQRARQALLEVRRDAQGQGKSASAMPRLAALLPPRRSMVFVVSDFHWPVGLLELTVASLALHDVVPVILDAPDPLAGLPTRGVCRLNDVETGAERTVWMRPALRKAIERADIERRGRLDRQLDALGLRPLRLAPDFGGDDVTRYFLG